MRTEINKNEKIAAIVTVCSALVVVIFLCVNSLHFEWPPKDKPEPEKDEIVFGGEYVELNEIETPTYEESNPQEEGKPSLPADSEPSESDINPETPVIKDDVLTAEQEDELAAEKAEKEEEKRREQEKERINDKFRNAFTGTDSSNTGDSDKYEIDSRVGMPGFNLKGRSLLSPGKPSSPVEGKVKIEIRVNPEGKVIEAQCIGGEGKAAMEGSVRRSCEEASKQSKFSAARDMTTDQIGTITWTFE